MSNEKEKFLLFRIRAFNDENAFNKVVDLYKDKVTKFLSFKLPTSHDAEDAVAETWIRFWRYARGTKIESISGIIFTIARGVVYDFYKLKEKRNEQALPASDEAPELSDPLHEQIINQVDVSILKELIVQLDEEDAHIILMRHVQQMRIKDMAKELGLSENAASVKLHRAINKFRTSILEKFGEL
ncbi:MAG: sigma-70 family RNA polymerase sigma factor [Parcubacteria group bacterium]|nr:sigma-70 family RNA polymerase sigma factor [Parcubacteria group bacterium]